MFVQFRILLVTACLLATEKELIGQTLKERTVLTGNSERVSCVAFSPDGKTLATACRMFARPNERWAELRLWDVATNKERALQKCNHAEINRMAFSPDGKLLATGSGIVTLWDITADKERVTLKERTTLKLGLNSLSCLAFSADGKKLGAADNKEAKVCDVAKEREDLSFRIPSAEWPVYSPDLRTLAVPNNQDVDLWDTATGKLRSSFLDHRGSVRRLAFTADGKTLVVGSNRGDADGKEFGEVKLWDTVEGTERATIDQGEVFPNNLAISPDGKILVLQESEGFEGKCELKMLDLPRGTVLGTVSFKKRSEIPYYLTISPDGKTLVGDCADGTLKLWDIVVR